MRYPYLESQCDDWDYPSLYYGPAAARHENGDLRFDVDSDRLRFADVLVDITRLGGDPDEQVDAILYWVAAEASREMRVGTVLKSLDSALALWNCSDKDDFSRRLADRATGILRGAALVGALRAIAWHLAQTSKSSLRADLVRQARVVLDENKIAFGHSVLLADDAHVHLGFSERVREGNEELRDIFARTGTLLLGAAHAHAIQEPWDPFVQSRMKKECLEHANTLERVMAGEPAIRAAFEGSVRILDESGREAQTDFEAVLAQVGSSRDLEAYFRCRTSRKSSNRSELLDPAVSQFIRLETEMRRFL
jgi:hypothetical protein